jgi:hypothetical protein
MKTNNSPASGIAKGRKSKCSPTSATTTREAPVASNTSASAISPGLSSGTQIANGRRKRPDLIDLAIFHAEYFQADQKAYASIPVYKDGECIGREVCLVESQRFANWLGLLESQERGEGLTSAALKKLTATLKSRALYTGVERAVHLRVAHHEGAYYVDMGDKAGRAFKITAQGWEIVGAAPVTFIRSPDSAPFVEPLPPGAGNIDNLWRIVPEGDRDVVLTYMIESLRPETPYPILFFHAGYGSAKSTTQKNIRSVIDPSRAPFGGNATNVRDLRAIAANTHVVSMENVSELRGEIQDMMCSLATGGAGGTSRRLHTNADVHSVSVKRPVMVNSIVQPITRSDLLSRTLTIRPVQPTVFVPEAEMHKLEGELMPSILGGFLDLFSAALRQLPEVVLSEEAKGYRLADYLPLGEAVSRARGKKPGEFANMYTVLRQNEAMEMADDHPVAAWIVNRLSSGTEIKDAVGKLHTLLFNFKVKEAPRSPRALRDLLDRLKPTLEHAGIRMDFRTVSGRSVVAMSIIEGSPLGKARAAAKAAEAEKLAIKMAKKVPIIVGRASRCLPAKRPVF